MVQTTANPQYNPAAATYGIQYAQQLQQNQNGAPARSRRASKVDRFGVRRYRRYLNKVWLLHEVIENQEELEDEDISPIENNPSQFSQMFTDTLTWNLLLPFSDCTEEEQEVLYLSLTDKKQDSNNNSKTSTKKTVKERFTKTEVSRTSMNKASHKYYHLDKKVQVFVEDKTHAKYLRALEDAIISACDSESSQWIELKLEDSSDAFERFICHGICQFYGVPTHSKNTSKGKAFMIKRPDQFNLPPIKLSTFLLLNEPQDYNKEN